MDKVALVQQRLMQILSAERELTQSGPLLDVIDKSDLLARFGLLAADALNAFNDLVSAARHDPVNGAAFSTSSPENEWQPLDKIPRDGTPFELRTSCVFRWLRYKPNSQPAREGKIGRWQRLDDKGQWVNTPPPIGEWRPL